MLAPKKDSSRRLLVDYRKLIAVTKRDAHPFSRIHECFDSFGELTVLSELDADSEFWQVEVENKNRDKTAFISRDGLYRFEHMPFGLRNASITFQRAMDIALLAVKWQFALGYFDSINFFPLFAAEHIDHV